MQDFLEELATTRVTSNVFNQYSYEYKENSIRRKNLLIYLRQMDKLKPKIILIGEAPGYKGCRLTGVPFTSEYILMGKMKGVDLFGEDNGYRLVGENFRLTKEATATMIWQALLRHKIIVLGWNAFPFHPHKKGDGRSNRTPLKAELLIGEKFIYKMIQIFKIEKLVAMGNKAGESLSQLGIKHQQVRHPAQGGKKDFNKGIDLLVEKLIK